MESQIDVRPQNINLLIARGFHVPPCVPPLRPRTRFRTVREIVCRMLVLQAKVDWLVLKVPLAESAAARFGRSCAMHYAMTPGERPMLTMTHAESMERYSDEIHSWMERMAVLAWVLGYDVAPTVSDTPITPSELARLYHRFLARPLETLSDVEADVKLRSEEEVTELRDLLFCAYWTLRNGRVHGAAPPFGFDAAAADAIIFHQLHALAWCGEPDWSWDVHAE